MCCQGSFRSSFIPFTRGGQISSSLGVKGHVRGTSGRSGSQEPGDLCMQASTAEMTLLVDQPFAEDAMPEPQAIRVVNQQALIDCLFQILDELILVDRPDLADQIDINRIPDDRGDPQGLKCAR